MTLLNDFPAELLRMATDATIQKHAESRGGHALDSVGRCADGLGPACLAKKIVAQTTRFFQ